MKQLFDDVSYDISQQITRKYSTSFSLAVKMLSPSIQPAIHAIYGFVRLADEIVDSFHEYPKEILLDEFEANLNIAMERGISLNPVLNAFQHVVRKYNIDDHLIRSFIESMRADLYESEYTSEESYNNYIYGSADVVGLMCLKVFVNGHQHMYDQLEFAARKLGSAFQKVNFLRDLKEDSQTLERSYFPQLDRSNITPQIKKIIVEEIEGDFREAYKGIKRLPNEARFGVYTAYIYYRKLLHKIKKANAEEIMQSRIRIGNHVKIGLLAKSFFNYRLNLL